MNSPFVADIEPQLVQRARSAEFLQLLKTVEHYQWFSEEDRKRAIACFKALVQTNDLATKQFLTASIVDVLHHDRAVHVSTVCELPPPMRKSAIPTMITQGKAPYTSFYHLVEHEFAWDNPPLDAVDSVAAVVSVNKPDRFWIAEYERIRVTWDPIIYAVYGNWHVEVARWD